MKDMNEVEGFYQAVAEMLKCEGHGYDPFPFGRRTRWNNRIPGSGRFPGHGLVRYFGPANIHVALIDPPIRGVFQSTAEALEMIRSRVPDASPSTT